MPFDPEPANKMAENSLAKAGLSAEDWLKMWDGGWTHDCVHDETHLTSCGEECSAGGESHHGGNSNEGCHSCDDGDQSQVDVHLKRNLQHLTGGDANRTILVSLCGNSPDMEWLCSRGYEVVGTEISETAVKAAFEKAICGSIPFKVTVDGGIKTYSATDDKNLRIVVGNFFDDAINADKLGTFDCVWDAHGIVSLPVHQQKPYAEKLGSFVKPGGKILFTTVDYDITKLKAGPAPAPVGTSLLQELYPQCKVELLETKPLTSGELKGVEEWNNLVVMVTFT